MASHQHPLSFAVCLFGSWTRWLALRFAEAVSRMAVSVHMLGQHGRRQESQLGLKGWVRYGKCKAKCKADGLSSMCLAATPGGRS